MELASKERIEKEQLALKEKNGKRTISIKGKT